GTAEPREADLDAPEPRAFPAPVRARLTPGACGTGAERVRMRATFAATGRGGVARVVFAYRCPSDGLNRNRALCRARTPGVLGRDCGKHERLDDDEGSSARRVSDGPLIAALGSANV